MGFDVSDRKKLEAGIRDRGIERMCSKNEILKNRVASLPTRYEYWTGVIAIIAGV